MEEGMMLGYEEIDSFVKSDRLSRLMVFTDAMPNVGATDASSFEGMARAAAQRGYRAHLLRFRGTISTAPSSTR